MNVDVKKMSLPRALIAGLFCGFITAVVILFYAVIFREDTGFRNISSIGPLTVSVGAPLMIVLTSTVYYFFVHYLSRGELLYKIIFSLMMSAGIFFLIYPYLSDGKDLLALRHIFLFGIVCITGLASTFFLPYLVHHPAIYLTAHEIRFENK